jgi:hypothetical protein
MPFLSTHEDTSSQFAKREKIAAPLVKAIGTFFAVTGPRSSNGHYKPLLNPGGGSASETAVWRFQTRSSRYLTVSEVKRLNIYNGYM